MTKPEDGIEISFTPDKELEKAIVGWKEHNETDLDAVANHIVKTLNNPETHKNTFF